MANQQCNHHHSRVDIPPVSLVPSRPHSHRPSHLHDLLRSHRANHLGSQVRYHPHSRVAHQVHSLLVRHLLNPQHLLLHNPRVIRPGSHRRCHLDSQAHNPVHDPVPNLRLSQAHNHPLYHRHNHQVYLLHSQVRGHQHNRVHVRLINRQGNQHRSHLRDLLHSLLPLLPRSPRVFQVDNLPHSRVHNHLLRQVHSRARNQVRSPPRFPLRNPQCSHLNNQRPVLLDSRPLHLPHSLLCNHQHHRPPNLQAVQVHNQVRFLPLSPHHVHLRSLP